MTHTYLDQSARTDLKSAAGDWWHLTHPGMTDSESQKHKEVLCTWVSKMADWQSTELANPHSSGIDSSHSMAGPKEALITTAEVHVKQRRKVGRPIIYHVHTDDPGLPSAKRSVIRRRIANRESARRVRARRQELSDQMTTRVSALEEVNAKLRSDNEELQSAMMQLKRESKAINDAQADRSSQWLHATSFSMDSNSASVKSVNFMIPTTPGQRSQYTAFAGTADDFVPANFLRDVVLE